MFGDGIHVYVHQYSSEVCYGWGSKMDGSIEWDPNLNAEDDKKFRDYRGRVLRLDEEETV